MRGSPLLALLAACAAPAPPADSARPATEPADTGTPTDPDTTPTRFPLPADCTAPAVSAPPFVRIGADAHNDPPQFMELLDVELDGDLAWAAGQGGYVPVDLSDPTAPEVLFLDGNFLSRLHRVEALGPGVLAGANRDDGLSLLDVSDPAAPVLLAQREGVGWEGLAAVGTLLYVASRTDGLLVFDVSDPSDPVELAVVPGLPATWELAAGDDGWLYAADATLGIVPVDLSDPVAPVLGPGVALPGAATHVVVDGDHLYAAAGGAGVVVLDRADPAAPRVVAQVETGGTAVAVAASDGWVYAADHEGVAVIDVADPAHPVPFTRVDTEMFALAVDAEGTRVVVGDWGIIEVWALDPGLRAPAASLAGFELTRVDGVARATLSNRGAGDLEIVGATSSDGAPVEAGALRLGPGASTWIEVAGAGPAEVCLATNDPYAPLRTLLVDEAKPPVGIVAPDFTLDDLDGTPWHLADHIGEPVFITFFATW